MNRHQLIDARSLAFGRAIADRLIESPELVEIGRENLRRWLQTCSPRLRTTLEEWQVTLNGPLAGVIELLTSTDERSIRLRQSNPFAGVLGNAERNQIILQFHANESPRA